MLQTEVISQRLQNLQHSKLVRPRRRHFAWVNKRRRVIQANNGSNDSIHSSDDEGSSLARELERVRSQTDPEMQRDRVEHLNLLWKVSSNRRGPEPCSCCHGSGEQECEWCHGTGAMTIGDTLYCSEGGCTPCPVCKGNGYCKCGKCRGTGKLASWMPTTK